jgi:hypothetical protein
MTYLRHQYTVAIAFFLLTVICLQSSGVSLVQRPVANGRRNIPTCHCCHAKVFLKLDRGFDLKPVLLLPSRVVCVGDPAVRLICSSFLLFCLLPAGTSMAVRLRGPPGISLFC